MVGHMVKFDPLQVDPCKMQRGFNLLLCASVLPFWVFSASTPATVASTAGEDIDLDSDFDQYQVGGLDSFNFDENVADRVATNISPLMFSPMSPYPFNPGQSSSAAAVSSFSGTSVILNPNANAEGRYGLQNHSNICYMSAFLTATFNIRRFREAVYNCEPENVSTTMLALVFAKLQTSKDTVKTNICLMPAVTHEFPWVFGGFQCNMEFGGRFLDMLPNSVKELYNLKLRTHYRLKEGQTLLKTAEVVETHLIVPPKYPSLLEAIESRFPDHEAEDFIIERKDFHEYAGIIPEFAEEKKSFAIYNEVSIANRPEMMVFGIRRRNMLSFDVNPMALNFEMLLPGLEAGSAPVLYVLKSFCVHLPNPPHYISYVRDFSRGEDQDDWYIYDDSVVSAVRTAADYDKLKLHADTSATLAFYVRADVISGASREPVIPPRIMTLTKLIVALEDIRARKGEFVSETAHNSNGGCSSSSSYYPPPSSSEKHSSPLANRLVAPSTPESVHSRLDSIMNVSPMINVESRFEDRQRLSRNIPSPTHKIFLDMFPLDHDYFPEPAQEA